METLTFVNNMLKYTFISIMSFYVFIKATDISNISKNQFVILSFSSIFIGLFYAILIFYIPSVIILPFIIVIISFIIVYIRKTTIEDSIIVSFISMAITIGAYIVSLAIAIAIALLPFIRLDKQNPLILLICGLIEFLFLNRFFHIPRFKHGLSFLKNTEKINSISIVVLILSGLLIVFFSLSKLTRAYGTKLIRLFRICPYYHWYIHLDKKKYYIRLSR